MKISKRYDGDSARELLISCSKRKNLAVECQDEFTSSVAWPESSRTGSEGRRGSGKNKAKYQASNGEEGGKKAKQKCYGEPKGDIQSIVKIPIRQ